MKEEIIITEEERQRFVDDKMSYKERKDFVNRSLKCIIGNLHRERNTGEFEYKGEIGNV